MKRLLILALLALVGCSHSTPPPTAPGKILVSWKTDGNPGAIPCTATLKLVSCISTIVVTDVTLNASYNVAPTDFSVAIVGNATDVIQVRVTGFNGSGMLLTTTPVIVTVT